MKNRTGDEALAHPASTVLTVQFVHTVSPYRVSFVVAMAMAIAVAAALLWVFLGGGGGGGGGERGREGRVGGAMLIALVGGVLQGVGVYGWVWWS